MPRVELGSLVREIVTGLEGIVMGRTEYLTGCAHVGIVSRQLTKDGTLPDWQWVDEKRVVVLERGVVQLMSEEPVKASLQGGPAPNPPSM